MKLQVKCADVCNELALLKEGNLDNPKFLGVGGGGGWEQRGVGALKGSLGRCVLLRPSNPDLTGDLIL